MLLPQVDFPNAGNSPPVPLPDAECATRTRRGNGEWLPQPAMPLHRPTDKWCCPRSSSLHPPTIQCRSSCRDRDIVNFLSD